MRVLGLAVVLGAALVTGAVVAQEAPDYFGEVMHSMHQNMMVPPTGDVDIDFMKSMIPHHQGAIDMANIVLEHGKDAEVRALAEAVVKAQTAEIDQMKKWLLARGEQP